MPICRKKLQWLCLWNLGMPWVSWREYSPLTRRCARCAAESGNLVVLSVYPDGHPIAPPHHSLPTVPPPPSVSSCT